jgi:hypothetical protein
LEETGVHRENHWPAASHWQTLSHNVVSSTSCLSGIRTHNASGDRHCLQCYTWIISTMLHMHDIYNVTHELYLQCYTWIIS